MDEMDAAYSDSQRRAQGRLAHDWLYSIYHKRRYYIWEEYIGLKVKNDIKAAWQQLNCRREGIEDAEQSFEGQEELELP
jgi:hypothetical protein